MRLPAWSMLVSPRNGRGACKGFDRVWGGKSGFGVGLLCAREEGFGGTIAPCQSIFVGVQHFGPESSEFGNLATAGGGAGGDAQGLRAVEEGGFELLFPPDFAEGAFVDADFGGGFCPVPGSIVRVCPVCVRLGVRKWGFGAVRDASEQREAEGLSPLRSSHIHGFRLG
jgi:hypothetical protein